VKWVDERLDATGRALSGVPGPAIVEACEEAGIDLLVAGSRSHGPLARTLLGSVSRQLAHNASCPVLVVPRPVARPEEAGHGQRRSHHQVA
jgi:nucleotide-binding universal stress UspA family protein